MKMERVGRGSNIDVHGADDDNLFHIASLSNYSILNRPFIHEIILQKRGLGDTIKCILEAFPINYDKGDSNAKT